MTTTSRCSPRSAVTATHCTTTKPRPRRPASGKSSSRAESPAQSSTPLWQKNCRDRARCSSTSTGHSRPPYAPGTPSPAASKSSRYAPTNRSPNYEPPSPATTEPSSSTEQQCVTRWIPAPATSSDIRAGPLPTPATGRRHDQPHTRRHQGPPDHPSVSTPHSVDGLRRSTQQRSAATRRKITKALREMRKQRLAINPHALAKYAGIARKSIHNHPDLLEQIRAESTSLTPRPAPAAPEPANESSIVAALRELFRAQKLHYETEFADLKAENKRLERALAAATAGVRKSQTGGFGRSPVPVRSQSAAVHSPPMIDKHIQRRRTAAIEPPNAIALIKPAVGVVRDEEVVGSNPASPTRITAVQSLN